MNGFKNGFHHWIQCIFLVVVEAKNFFPKFFFQNKQNFDPLYRPVAGKPLVLEILCLEVVTSVASALTAETVFEIMKCISDVDMGSVPALESWRPPGCPPPAGDGSGEGAPRKFLNFFT